MLIHIVLFTTRLHTQLVKMDGSVCEATTRTDAQSWRAYLLYPGDIAQSTPSTRAGERNAQGMLFMPPPAVMYPDPQIVGLTWQDGAMSICAKWESIICRCGRGVRAQFFVRYVFARMRTNRTASRLGNRARHIL